MLLTYGNYTCTPDWKVCEEHAPGYCRVYLVHSGDVTYDDYYATRALNRGFLYIFPSSRPYKIIQIDSDPLICTFLHIDFFPNSVENLIEIDMHEHPILLHLFRTLKECIDEREVELTRRLNYLFELYCRKHSIIQPVTPLIEELLEYIREHFNEKLSNARLSQHLGFNEHYFIRLFRKQVGMTPHQYLINYRILEAKMKMMSDSTLSAIAEETGFPDVKSFSRTFKLKTGLSPSAYRRISEQRP